MGGMHWRDFVVFNVIGGLTWSTLFVLLGYFFGGIPFVQKHFELLIIGIIAVSMIPTVFGLIRSRLKK
jgi:membrane-associated protein